AQRDIVPRPAGSLLPTCNVIFRYQSSSCMHEAQQNHRSAAIYLSLARIRRYYSLINAAILHSSQQKRRTTEVFCFHTQSPPRMGSACLTCLAGSGSHARCPIEFFEESARASRQS